MAMNNPMHPGQVLGEGALVDPGLDVRGWRRFCTGMLGSIRTLLGGASRFGHAVHLWRVNRVQELIFYT